MNGDRYQVDTVGGRGGFAERGERGGVFGVAGLSGGSWLLQGRLAASFGRCRSLWRQLAAAGPSGGELWPLQVSLAAIGCCRAVQGRCTRPSFNGAAAVEHSLCYLQVMLLLF